MQDTTNNLGPTLLKAMRASAIEVHYQPQMTADGASVAAVEALIRWRRDDGTLIMPDKFISVVAADPILAESLSVYVLEQACKDALQWPGVTVGVNIEPLQFSHPRFAEIVSDILSATGLEPGRLELEILETSWFADAETALKVIKQLRARGVKIAMDDFGTGFASLGALLDLPLDKLKIDRAFVSHCHEIRSASIVHAIIALARAIGLKVTAEGVETKTQASFLRAAGCHYLQGYYFSRPVRDPDISAMLQSPRAVSACA